MAQRVSAAGNFEPGGLEQQEVEFRYGGVTLGTPMAQAAEP